MSHWAFSTKFLSRYLVFYLEYYTKKVAFFVSLASSKNMFSSMPKEKERLLLAVRKFWQELACC
jgi:hypothetical protein